MFCFQNKSRVKDAILTRTALSRGRVVALGDTMSRPDFQTVQWNQWDSVGIRRASDRISKKVVQMKECAKR